MITQGVCDSFRLQLLNGLQNFNTDHIYMALYQDGLGTNLSPQITNYSSSGEIVASGYTAGGQLLTGQVTQYQPGAAWVQWNNPSWMLPAGTPIDGALLYNASKSNSAVLVLSFGSTRYPSPQGVFTVVFPPDPAINAILRLA